ncbi:hypothetical protein [Paracoccus siganidrum]|nr:hypothetical protein [Paracoccus siganidrum]RMC33417.1 hypothetical protein C9E82_13280 [Paracoccus siganidrum]
MAAQRLCLDVAMQACLGHVDERRLTWAQRAVLAGLPEGDPLRSDLDRFARSFPDIRRDPELLMSAGDELWDAVKRSTWPRPSARADLEG